MAAGETDLSVDWVSFDLDTYDLNFSVTNHGPAVANGYYFTITLDETLLQESPLNTIIDVGATNPNNVINLIALSPLTDGVHSFEVCVDNYDRNLVDPDTTNDCSTTVVGGHYDLAVTAIRLNSDNRMEFDITNVGDEAIGVSNSFENTYTITRHEDPTDTTTDIYTYDVNEPFAPNDVETIITGNILATGEYDVSVLADSGYEIDESHDGSTNEGNNYLEETLTVNPPSLTVEAGQDQIINAGDELILDNQAYVQNGEPIVNLTGATINWGDNVTENATLFTPAIPGFIFLQGSHVYSTDGTYTVEVCASNGASPATCDTFALTVKPYVPPTLPDLIISNISASEDGQLSYTITNQGTGYVMNYETLEASVAITYPNGNVLPLIDIPGVHDVTFSQNGGSSTISVATLSEAGAYSVTVCADSSFPPLELESDHTNNCTLVNFTWGTSNEGGNDQELPDLVIDSVTLNADHTLHIVVSNHGLGVLPPANFFNLIVTDLTNGDGSNNEDWRIGAEDFFINSNYVVPTLPATILVVVDANNDVVEENEDVYEANYYRIVVDDLTITAGADQSITAGSALVLDGEAYVQNGTSSIPLTSATINWGDGTATENATQSVLTVPSLSVVLGGSHTYSTAGSYAVTVCATNSASSVCDSLNLTVNAIPATPVTGGGGGGSSGGSGGSSHHHSNPTVVLTEDTEIPTTTSEEVVLTEEEVAACGAMTFVDVDENTVGYDSIYALWCQGVIHGMDSTHFAPEETLKRDQATKIISRLFGYVTMAHSDIPEVTETSYSDVSTDEPLAYYVETMTDAGFFAAEEAADAFRPHEDISIQEIVKFVNAASDVRVQWNEYDLDTIGTRGGFMNLVYGIFQQ